MSGLHLEVRTEYMEVHIFKSVSDHPGSTMEGVQAPKAQSKYLKTAYGVLRTEHTYLQARTATQIRSCCIRRTHAVPFPPPSDVHTACFFFYSGRTRSSNNKVMSMMKEPWARPWNSKEGRQRGKRIRETKVLQFAIYYIFLFVPSG